MKLYFSDFFEVDPETIEKYGAFNVSLVSDLPLFIDPFLLFNSRKRKYKELHENIITYLKFLRDKSLEDSIDTGLIRAWYTFPEVKQNWLGFTISSNRGSGLGMTFATALHGNLNHIFNDFGSEKVTKGTHLEKLCIIRDRVGRDNISDFTTNLIKDFLLKYTQEFAEKHINEKFLKRINVSKVRFNFETESWEGGLYNLPYFDGDFVVLTPSDILTKDETWINKNDLINQFALIPEAISNDQLRAQVNNYFKSVLGRNPSREIAKAAAFSTIQRFPELIDYYIKYKEDNGQKAESISSRKVEYSKQLYIQKFGELIENLAKHTGFYGISGTTYEEAHQRVRFLKNEIENNDGYRIFYVNGKPIEREQDLQILYKLTWFATVSDVNREVNNGRGAVDFKISRGSDDKTLVEFKLASNTQLERNLKNQVAIYEAANNTKNSIKVILYFSMHELNKVERILRRLKLDTHHDIVLIDARKDNKPSASKA